MQSQTLCTYQVGKLVKYDNVYGMSLQNNILINKHVECIRRANLSNVHFGREGIGWRAVPGASCGQVGSRSLSCQLILSYRVTPLPLLPLPIQSLIYLPIYIYTSTFLLYTPFFYHINRIKLLGFLLSSSETLLRGKPSSLPFCKCVVYCFPGLYFP